MAIQKEFKVKNGMVVRNTATFVSSDGIVTTATSSNIIGQPLINLNFLNGTLDPRITFTRSSGASYVNKNGFISYVQSGQPRFDYSPSSTGTIRGLLVEEQRTNLIVFSQDQTQWASNPTPNNYYPTANAATAPDGTPTATFILKPITLGNSTVYKTWSGTTSTYYAGSIWLKAGGYSRAAVVFTNSSFANVDTGATVNLSTGSIISVLNSSTVSVTPYGNSWYRVSITALSSSTTGNYVFAFYPLDNSNSAVFAGDGVSGIYSWGAQVETSQYGTTWPENFFTSYIPTFASQVTRSGDDARIVGQSITSTWNQNNGTLFAEWVQGIQGSASALQGSTGVTCFTNPLYGYNGYGISVSPASNGTDAVIDQGRNQSNYSRTNSWPYSSYLTYGQTYKSVVAWDPNTVYGMTDGYSLQTVSNTVVYKNFIQPCNTLYIGNQNIGGVPDTHLNGWVRRIQWWPTTLNSFQIQSLTTTTSFSNTNFAGLTAPATHSATTSNFTIGEGLIVPKNLEVPDVDKLYITNLTRPTQQPSLNLNFLKGTLDSRISFTRASGATVVGPAGLITYVGNNTPRFDYSSTSTGTCLGLLIEEQRTNLLPYSSSVGGTSWNTRAGTVSILNAGISPDGTSNATLVTNSSGDGYVWQAINLSTSTSYTLSVYAAIASGSPTIRFNAYTGVAGQPFTSGTSNLTSNYKRYSFSFTSTATVSTGDIGFYIQSGSALVWGAQVEAGTFPTSYIPTTSAQATRPTEIANISGQNFQSWFNMNQGTLYVEADSPATAPDTVNAYRWAVSLSTGNGQKIGFYKIYNSMGFLPKIADDQYVSRFEPLLSTLNTSTVFSAALSYASGSQFAAFNYSSTVTGTSSVMPKFIDNLRIGNGDSPWCGHIRRIVYYPEQLANTATQALTAI